MTDTSSVGWAFPLALDARGRITTVRGARAVEQAILMLLLTRRGERVMRPEYGCRIHDLAFAPGDATTLGLAAFHVDEAIRTWEPRVDVLHVEARLDDAHPERIVVDVRYRLRSDGTRHAITFPFDRVPPGRGGR